MTMFLIRPATIADIPAIFIVRTSVRENLMTRADMAAIGITEDSVTAMITGAECAWVATVDDTVVGFSMADLDDACLFAAFVLPAQEGRGIGRRLVAAAETALFARHEEIWLETGRATRAAGFYRALGWGGETDIGPRDIRLVKRRAKTGA